MPRKRKDEKHRALAAPEWKIQPGERPEDFELFTMYRQLGKNGTKRTLETLVRLVGTKEENVKKEINRIGNTSTRWGWRKRIEAYENFLDQQAIEDDIRSRKEMRKRLTKQAEAAQGGCMVIISKFLKKQNEDPKFFDNIKEGDLTRIALTAAEKLVSLGEFERKVRGEPTEYVKQEGFNTNMNMNMNVDKMSHEELVEHARKLGFERARSSNAAGKAK